jgi:4'-phosphopantetheinyl transferase
MSTTTPLWKTPPARLTLEEGDIHVWRADLEDLPAERLDALRAILSSEERQRADRFRFERHRRRFTLCRGLLKTLLGRYLAAPADRIEFAYGEHGKPGIKTPAVGRSLCFNLAHSHHLALFAFARNRPLGVDIEYQREMPRAEDLARRFFSPDEYAGIMRLPPNRRQEGFFRCWTGKEAYVKATGAGFSFPMDQFSVSPDPDGPSRLIRVAGAPGASRSWSLTAFIPEMGYQAALAEEGHDARRFWWEAGPILRDGGSES